MFLHNVRSANSLLSNVPSVRIGANLLDGECRALRLADSSSSDWYLVRVVRYTQYQRPSILISHDQGMLVTHTDGVGPSTSPRHSSAIVRLSSLPKKVFVESQLAR